MQFTNTYSYTSKYMPRENDIAYYVEHFVFISIFCIDFRFSDTSI